MDASLFISKTGLDAQQRRMSVISNNLANVSTTGFKGKSDFGSFCRIFVKLADRLVLIHRPYWAVNGNRNTSFANEKIHNQGNIITQIML